MHVTRRPAKALRYEVTAPGVKDFTFHLPTTPGRNPKKIGDIFDVNIPDLPKIAEIEQLRTDLEALAAKYPKPDFTTVALSTEPDKWPAALDKMAHNETIRSILDRDLKELHHRMWEGEKAARNSGDLYDHIIDHLPLDEVEETFTNAARALDAAAFQAGLAVDKDPVALRNMRKAGQQLTALSSLPINPVDGGDNPRRVALFAGTTPLPPLTADQYSTTGPATPTSSPEDQKHHEEIEDAIRASREDHTTFLIHLAQGKWPRLHLQVARTHEEFEERFNMFLNAGVTEITRVTIAERNRRRRHAQTEQED